jgi:rhamnose transport system ATP-binding protein
VTVLRDGQRVWTRAVADAPVDQLIRAMVGREVEELIGRHPQQRQLGEVRLEVDQLTRRSVFESISFVLRAGEILGLAGLVGAGRSEIARAVFGIDRYDSGTVSVGGRRLAPGSVRAAMAAGVALVPEDRQHEGLILPMSVGANLSLAMLDSLSRCGFIRSRREQSMIQRQMSELSIRASSPQAPAETLSGGNQQKLVLGKWLASQPAVLILDEPSRGVDVGAKAQVHRLIRQLAEQGLATLVISSELPELLSICDRVLVVRQGRIVGERSTQATTQEELLQLALPDVSEISVP